MTFQQACYALLTLLRKEVGRCFRIWPQTVAAPVVTTTLYFFIFGKVIGSHIADQHGFPYIQYIVPGLILMATLINAYVNTSSSFFGAKFAGSIEELLVSPMPATLIVFGYAMGGVFRGALVGCMVALVAICVTHVHFVHPVLVVYSMLVTAFVFALVGIINGVFARKFDDVSWVPNFIISPLTYFAGVFYSVQMLPPFWQAASHLDPIYYLVSAFRFSMLGVKDATTSYALAVSTVLAIGAFILTTQLLIRSKRMRS
ncbi:MAG: ABC transporter permease [Legionellales bacterium]|nr:ABC transporter permease [Legionellales bacterium]HAG61630.1 ABC transporter permease [Coxiellaceae bacterium]|tara:strand:+ start:283 stop:1056 length:774 start_codon:yes stop_codon:yes gene_type:complete